MIEQLLYQAVILVLMFAAGYLVCLARNRPITAPRITLLLQCVADRVGGSDEEKAQFLEGVYLDYTKALNRRENQC
jgi:hypothetical protein